MGRKPRKKRNPDREDPGPGSLLGLIGTESGYLLQPLHFRWSLDWRNYTLSGGASSEEEAVHQASRAVAQVFGAPPEIEYAFTDEHQLFALYSVLIGGMAEDPKYPMRSPGAAQLYVSLARYPGSYEPPAPLEQQDFGYFTLSRYAKENPKRKKGTQARKNRWWGKPAKQPRSKAKGRFKVKFELWEATRQGDPSSLAPSMRDTIEFDTPDAFARWYSNLASHPDAMLRIKRAALDGKDIDPKVVLGVAANNNPTNPRYFVRDLDDPDWGLVLDADNAAAAMVEARERTGKRRGRFEVYARFVGGEPVRFNPKYPMGAAQMRQKLAELDKLYEYGEIDDATYHRLRSEMAYASQRGTGPGHALAALERKVAARPAQRWPSESYIPRLQREDLERPGGHRHRVVTSLLAAGRWERALRILEKLDGSEEGSESSPHSCEEGSAQAAEDHRTASQGDRASPCGAARGSQGLPSDRGGCRSRRTC
jgi:hypothetical protein